MDEHTLQFVQTVVVPQYWEAPNGRGARHLNDVLASARRLVGRELDDREYLAVALHDVGVGRKGWSRDDHPEAALVAIDQDPALEPVRGLVDGEVREAIRCHMAAQYRQTGLLGPIHQLLVEADEGAPVWGRDRIVKPVKYWLDGRGMPLDAPTEDVVAHVLKVLRKKVSAFKSGEPPFTSRYCEVFREEIEQASEWVNGVGEKDVLSVMESMAFKSFHDLAPQVWHDGDPCDGCPGGCVDCLFYRQFLATPMGSRFA